nr:hypothetical protein [Cetobacterium somerae]
MWTKAAAVTGTDDTVHSQGSTGLWEWEERGSKANFRGPKYAGDKLLEQSCERSKRDGGPDQEAGQGREKRGRRERRRRKRRERGKEREGEGEKNTSQRERAEL